MTRVLRAAVTTLVLTFLLMPLDARPASACMVSYGYRPSIKVEIGEGGSLFGNRGTCSTGHSLAGAAIVAVLALGSVAALGAYAYRKGRAAAGGASRADDVLATYLVSTRAPGAPGAR